VALSSEQMMMIDITARCCQGWCEVLAYPEAM